MRRRLTSTVLTLVLLLQALVMAPASFAFCADAPQGSPAHCAQHMSGKHCPCCPDGAMKVGGCTTSCAAFAASNVSGSAFSFEAATTTTTPFVARFSLTQTYAPLNPPPIH